MARVAYITEGDGPAAAQAALAEVVRGRGYVSNFHRTLAHVPDILRAFEGFSAAVRCTPLADRLRELAICRVSALVGNEYEWRRHTTTAIDAGVPKQQLAELGNWRGSDTFDDAARAVLNFVDAHVVRSDTDAAVDELARHFDDAEIVSLCAIVGWYLLVSAIILPLRLSDEDPKPPAAIKRPDPVSLVAQAAQQSGSGR